MNCRTPSRNGQDDQAEVGQEVPITGMYRRRIFRDVYAERSQPRPAILAAAGCGTVTRDMRDNMTNSLPCSCAWRRNPGSAAATTCASSPPRISRSGPSSFSRRGCRRSDGGQERSALLLAELTPAGSCRATLYFFAALWMDTVCGALVSPCH